MDGGKKLDTKEREKVRIKRTPGGTKWKHVRAYRGVYLMTTPVLVAALIFIIFQCSVFVMLFYI